MAITSFDVNCNKPSSPNSLTSGNVLGCRVVKINFLTDSSATSTTKSTKSKKSHSKSPYLTNDRVQLLSRVTEKRMVHKKTTDFVSSFPLAANIYKANSDELNSLRRANKKVKKSVLTLPNDPAPLPQVCTVSDMNDSEYHEQKDENRKSKVKKRLLPNTKKVRVRNKDFEFYDRDARFCSQLNIDLDCSSTDMIKYNGDNKRLAKTKKSKNLQRDDKNVQAHDVWAVLRNINRFQFRPSPPMSEESAVLRKKKKGLKRRNNCKDTRVIETCRTEEFAYISSYELEGKSNRTFSQSSSVDRITVIDKQDEFSQLCEEFEKRILTTKDLFKNSHNLKRRNQIKGKNINRNTKNNMKSLGYITTKENHNRAVVLCKNNSKLTPFKNAIIGQENCHKVDNADIISCRSKRSTNSITPVQTNDVVGLTQSNYSGSSKAGLEAATVLLKDKLLLKVPSDDFGPQFKGISKVVLSKGFEKPVTKPCDIQKDLPKRKPRLVTTMLSNAIMPKLTQTEIKRRLARMKFPIVVLGKDQVNTSNIEVMDYNPPQFDGLDQHIWPFMLDWSGNKNKKRESSPNRRCSPNRCSPKSCSPIRCSSNRSSANSCSPSRCSPNRYSPNILESNSINPVKNNVDISCNKQSSVKERKYLNTGPVRNKIKPEDKEPPLFITPTPFVAINNQFQQYKKQKPILQLKERMLNLLYKKSSNKSLTKENLHMEGKKTTLPSLVNKVYTGTDIHMAYGDPIPDDYMKKRHISPDRTPAANKKPQNNAKPRWAKAKWASDFIENVIKKIKTGVYYTQDHKDLNRKYKINDKEISIETTSTPKPQYTCNQNYEHKFPAEEPADEPYDPLKMMSEFDNTLSAVEIKTFNRNQIAIKNCVTNIMVQFDVSIPTEAAQFNINPKISSSLIPIEVTESHTKIFKSKTTILNAILPAELCSILPKMMRNLIDVKVKSVQAAAVVPCPPEMLDKTESHLSTISEFTRCESPEYFKRLILSFYLSPKIRKLLDGMFPKKMIKYTGSLNTNKTVRKLEFNSKLISGLLPRVPLRNLLPFEMTRVTMTIPRDIQSEKLSLSQPKQELCTADTKASTALEPYIASNHSLIPTFKRYDFMSMVENIMKHHSFQIFFKSISYIDEFKIQYDGSNVTVNMSTRNNDGLDEKRTLIVDNLQLDSLYHGNLKIKNKDHEVKNNLVVTKCIEDIHVPRDKRIESKDSKDRMIVCTTKGKRRGFFKLYRKCKSATNIPSGEKCFNLSKISNLEDFFQVLGSRKWLSSVFDGYTTQKILSSVVEMRNWITEINPRQALLVLLLTNKKDTPNLVRFRPILLQGIAVNRITRATELDLEIEVIERENFNKLSQYEGISYLPASVENHDTLLEELYWIAKTTASDYQRPFDDSSERLLKSLLEKRKKLNPSYLRVMARYVGLGLLKSPVKK